MAGCKTLPICLVKLKVHFDALYFEQVIQWKLFVLAKLDMS